MLCIAISSFPAKIKELGLLYLSEDVEFDGSHDICYFQRLKLRKSLGGIVSAKVFVLFLPVKLRKKILSLLVPLRRSAFSQGLEEQLEPWALASVSTWPWSNLM